MDKLLLHTLKMESDFGNYITLVSLERFNIPGYEFCPVSWNYEEFENLHDRDELGHSLLHICVRRSSFCSEESQKIQNLIDEGVDLEIRSQTGRTAFLSAVVHRNKKIIEKLIENGADVHTQDNAGNNALHYMALPELNYWFEVEVTDSVDKFSLDDNYAILKILLEKGIDVNCINESQETPLMWASRGDLLDIVKMLLAYGGNVNLQNKNLENCLHLASLYIPDNKLYMRRWKEGDSAILTELVRNETSINCFNIRGQTALFVILSANHEKRDFFARELIKNATLVHWRRKITFWLNRELHIGSSELEYALGDYSTKCDSEIERMKYYDLSERINLCQFALQGVCETELGSAFEINAQVLDVLLQHRFEEYHYFMASNIQRSFLLYKLSELAFYLVRKGQRVTLDIESVLCISSFLKNGDLVNIISAFR